MADIDRLCIDTIRCLAMDAVQKANSGHPGTPMALAPVAYALWQDQLRYDPADSAWPNRDRFVLSVGHASMLLYALIHLAGVKNLDGTPALTLDDLKQFRQLHSKTPGHPESHLTTGVETTTGPLGQGCANSVGMAIASKWLAAHYNKPGFELFDFNVYALCGDGDMMEGISSEAGSLAGHLKLSNLCWIYDSNRITIEGSTDLAFHEDTAARFRAYGWNVLHCPDANDLPALKAAYANFLATTDRPTFILVNSHIAWGAPKKQDTHGAHGEPLGDDEIAATKKVYGWPPDEKFRVPAEVPSHFQAVLGQRGKELNAAWKAKFADYKAKYPDLAEQVALMQKRELPAGWDKDLPTFPPDAKGIASRESSAKVLNALAKNIPWLIGGAADLAPSTKTRLTFDGAGDFEAGNYGGRNFHFGIREHIMAAAINGMSLCGVRPYGAGFLIFSDYARPAIRLSSIMELPTIHVFTHDSVGVGEDGPTHQPIEQLPSLRAIPGMTVVRPGDANEVTECWRAVMKLTHKPALLLMSRQAMVTLDRGKYAPASGAAKGAYVLADAPGGQPDVILIASGTELQHCVAAHEKLVAEGVKARVVSMPCWEFFEQQDATYRESVLPKAVTARVAIEAASMFGWERYVPQGIVLGMHSFGASAPFAALMKQFGLTADAVYEAAKKLLQKT